MQPVQSIKVHAPGTDVVMCGSNIKGYIKTVQIGAQHIAQYEVVWWSGSTKNAEWFDREELIISESPSLEIGFHTIGKLHTNGT